MPTNSYFTHGTSGEQNLVEELVIEQIKMFGQDVYYIPRVIVDEDPAFGEDSLSKFDDAYLIEAYLENFEYLEPEIEVADAELLYQLEWDLSLIHI